MTDERDWRRLGNARRYGNRGAHLMLPRITVAGKRGFCLGGVLAKMSPISLALV